MRSPWVFSTAISMMVTTAVITLYLVTRPALAPLSERLKAGRAPATDGGLRPGKALASPGSVAPLGLILAAGCAALLLAVFPGVPAWVFLACIPIAVLFMVIETRGKAEMGIVVGMSSFIVLLIVGLAFDNVVPLLVLDGFVIATMMTFALTLSLLKQAEFCGVDTKGLNAMTLVGVVTGSVICVPFMRFFDALYGIGTASLPAPYSVMWAEMASSAVARVVSPSINPYLALAGVAIALVLYRYKVSAVTVAIGLILPVSTSAAIIAGGIAAWIIQKKGYLKSDNGIAPSGLMTGEIVVSILASLRLLL